MRRQISRRVRSALKRQILESLVLCTDRVLPEPLATRILLRLGIEITGIPTESDSVLRVCNYRGGARAAFCISVDFDNFHPWLDKHSDRIDEATAILLQLAEKYEIPMSWAICGITATLQPKSLRALLNSRVKHDIGVHTFHHVDCSSPSLRREDLIQEIMDCRRLLDSAADPATFIFPWDKVGHLDLLRELGFVAYRGKEIKLGYPERVDGLWNIPPFSLQVPIDPHLHQKSYKNVHLLKGAIDLAIAYGGVFHVYTHPWNIDIDGSPSLYASKVLEPLFQHAHRRMLEGKLWACTLRDLANHCEARMNCAVESCQVNEDHILARVSCRRLDERFDHPPKVTLAFDLPHNLHPSVFVDGVKVGYGDGYLLTKSRGKTRLLLTLRFDQLAREVELRANRKPSL